MVQGRTLAAMRAAPHGRDGNDKAAGGGRGQLWTICIWEGLATSSMYGAQEWITRTGGRE